MAAAPAVAASTKISSAKLAARAVQPSRVLLRESAVVEQAQATASTALRVVSSPTVDVPSAKLGASRQAPTKTPATNATRASISRR
jgi:type II secretory pathway component PulC